MSVASKIKNFPLASNFDQLKDFFNNTHLTRKGRKLSDNIDITKTAGSDNIAA